MTMASGMVTSPHHAASEAGAAVLRAGGNAIEAAVAMVGNTFGLLRNRYFAVGMTAMTCFFMGQFAVSTYLRPVLEFVTLLDVNGISLVLLATGLAGTTAIGFVLKDHLATVLIGFPAALAVISLSLIELAHLAIPPAVLLILWGLFTTPIPVAWSTWMTRVIPNELEAGGGLHVALIQFAITFGAFFGGLLYDTVGWLSPAVFSAVAFVGAAAIGVAATRSLPAAVHLLR